MNVPTYLVAQNVQEPCFTTPINIAWGKIHGILNIAWLKNGVKVCTASAQHLYQAISIIQCAMAVVCSKRHQVLLEEVIYKCFAIGMQIGQVIRNKGNIVLWCQINLTIIDSTLPLSCNKCSCTHKPLGLNMLGEVIYKCSLKRNKYSNMTSTLYDKTAIK